jgi:hypothetical protein
VHIRDDFDGPVLDPSRWLLHYPPAWSSRAATAASFRLERSRLVLVDDFAAPRLPVDPADLHDYAVDWDEHEAVFSVDGSPVRRCPRPPNYPMQLMLAMFDFPDWSGGDDSPLVPELVVEHVTDSPLPW